MPFEHPRLVPASGSRLELSPSPTRRSALKILGLGMLGLALGGCAGSSSGSVDFSARFAQFKPADEPNGDPSKVVWPDFVTKAKAGPEVKQLYEFQIVNGDLMRYMPCFCGCHEDDDHRNNRDCYVRAVNPDGSVVLDSMAPT